jgi:hypothetical protein
MILAEANQEGNYLLDVEDASFGCTWLCGRLAMPIARRASSDGMPCGTARSGTA